MQKIDSYILIFQFILSRKRRSFFLFSNHRYIWKELGIRAYSLDIIWRMRGIFKDMSFEEAISGTRQKAARTVTDSCKYASRLSALLPLSLSLLLPFPIPLKRQVIWTSFQHFFLLLLGRERGDRYRKYQFWGVDRGSEVQRRRKPCGENLGRRLCKIWWPKGDQRGAAHLALLSTASGSLRETENVPARRDIYERVEMEKSEKRRERCLPWKLRNCECQQRRDESEEGFRWILDAFVL